MLVRRILFFLIEVAVPNLFFFHRGNEFLTVISGVTDPAG